MAPTSERPDLLKRTLLKNAVCTAAVWGTTSALWAEAPPPTHTTLHDLWRAMSRTGYGPTPELVSEVKSYASPKAWSLAQVDLAFAASKEAPRIPAELTDFNQTLPDLFESAKKERDLRAQRKAGADEKTEQVDVQRFDFSGPRDPLHFSRLVAQQSAAWRLMASTRPQEENPLLARMTEFWFNHLNVYVGKGAVRPFVGHYIVHVARAHSLGKFEDLILASARHPAMLHYLDQAQSVADGTVGGQGKSRGLNENYARELMELHTLGVDGGYSQTDVRELARVLTGWTVGPKEISGYKFMPRHHDNGRKQVLGMHFNGTGFAGGESEGVNAIRMLARHPSTAKRVSLRLAQFFVSDTPSAALVSQLSQVFLSSQGDIREVMQTLLSSSDFWNPDNRLFKTPWDYACSVLSATQGATERRHIALTMGFLDGAGQPLHGWQTPDGYKTDAATWMVPEALTRRADYALSVSRQAPELGFLLPFLSPATRAAIAAEKPGLRAGLALASPDFMSK
jgi:uncharacterized protein (DUF1800 family)